MFKDANESAFADERLAARLAENAAARQTSAERMETDEQAAEFAHRFRMARAAERFTRAVPTYIVRETPAPVYGVPSDVIPLAAGARHAILVEPRVAAGAGLDFWDAPVESWLELPPDAPPGTYVAFPVRGDSMTPAIESNDIVLVCLGSRIAVDDVIIARSDEGYVVKYVSALDASKVELASFNAEQPTFTIDRDPQRIIGKVVARFQR